MLGRSGVFARGVMHWVVRAAGLALVLGGLWLVAAGVADGLATVDLVADGQDATGQVLRLESGPGGGGVVTVIGLRRPGAPPIELRDGPRSVADRAVGAPVRLILPPGRPDQARINEWGALWAGPAFRVLGGLAAMALGVAMMLTAAPDRRSRMRVPLAIRVALFGLAAGTSAIAWDSYSAVVDSLNRFPRGEGRVIALEDGRPRVIFVTGDGVTTEFVDSTIASWNYEVGDRVVVGYAKSSPAGARIERFAEVWSGAAWWGAAAGLCLLVFLYAATWRRRLPVPPPAAETVAAAPPLPAGPGLIGRGVRWGGDSWRRLRRERQEVERLRGTTDIELR